MQKNGFLSRLLLKMAAATGATFTPMDHDLVKNTFGGDQSAAGKTVNSETALTLSAVWSCQRILAETIGSLPWAVYKRDAKGNAIRADDHPLSLLLSNPNAEMTSAEFREANILGLCQSGNSYSLVERLAGRPTSLFPIRGVVAVQKNGSNTKLQIKEGTVFFRFNDRGRTEDLPREKVWHVKGFGHGIVGLSPIAAAREAMGFALATDEFGSRYFSNGGKPSGVVTIPQWIKDPEQRKLARENLNQMLGGLSNAHKFALFEGGMKPEPWGQDTLEDMAFVLIRKFSVQEICRFYRVPPHMVADLDKATFSNIEQQSQEFVQYTLMPYFTRIEASASKWLLPIEEQGTFFLRFNPEGLLRGDSAARSALWPVMLQNGVMTRNEVRAKENLNRIEGEGMDEHTVQSNLILIDDLDAVAEAMRKKTEAPIAPQPPAAIPPEKSVEIHNHIGEGERVGFNIALPEAVAKDAKYVVDHPGIVEILKAVKAIEKSTERRVAELERRTAEKLAEDAAVTKEKLDALAKLARSPRKPVFHSDGELAGAVVVEELTIH